MERRDPVHGNVRVLDVREALSPGALTHDVSWIYAGAQYRTHRRLLHALGSDREIPFREELYRTTYALKDAYIAFIGDLNCRHADAEWHLSGLSERNCFVSRAFASICILAAARTLLSHHTGPVLVVCDSPASVGYLKGLLDDTATETRPVPRWQILLRHLPAAIAHRIAFVALGAHRRLVASIFLGKPQAAHRYAILSFVYDRSFRHGYEDVVFGPLVPWLGLHGYDPAIIPLVIPPTSYATAVRGMRAAGKTFLVPEVFEPWGGRTRYALSSLLHPPAPLPPMIFQDMRVEEILEEDLIRDWVGRRALESRILGESVRRLCTERIFQAVTYPFENHVWEKAVCNAVRSVSDRSMLIGFQHSTIYSTLLNYFIAPCESASPYLPHRIVTSGSRAHDLLANSGYPGGMICRGGAIRFLRGDDAAAGDPKSGPFTVMVAPTVDRNESTELISRVLDACASLEGVHIVIRCHPDLPFGVIAPLLERPLPPNMTTGAGNTDQLRDAGVLVFASTSVAVEALAAGVPVIQLTTMDPLTGNRFEGFPPSRMLQFAHSDGELRHMVDTLRTTVLTPEDRLQAKEIVRQFFGPVDEGVYAQFLPGNTE